MNLTEEERRKVIRSLELAAGDTGEYPTEEEIEVACEKARQAKVDKANEVLARWAGFTEKKFRAPVCIHEPRCTYWVDPDGKDTRHLSDPNGKRLPDLIHSLDALGLWSIPNIEHLFEIEWMPQIGGWSCRITITTGSGHKPFYGRGTTMAEACADAILSLIGEDDE